MSKSDAQAESQAQSLRGAFKIYLALVVAALILPVICAWIDPRFANVRNWQILLNSFFLLFVFFRRLDFARLHDWRLPRLLLWCIGGGGLVAFVVATVFHYEAFLINGYDFSIFDFMLYNATHREFMTSPVCACNHMGVHPMWIMVPLIPLHMLMETPLFAVILHAFVCWSAIIPLWFMARHYLKNEALSVLLVIAYLTNAWTGTIVNHSFHPEAFFIPAGLFLIWGWITPRRWLWIVATAVMLAIKEDGAFYVAAFALAAWVFERKRWRAALILILVSLLLAVMNIKIVQPFYLSSLGKARPDYLTNMWGQYGSRLAEIPLGMLHNWPRVLGDFFTSGWVLMFAAFAFLPLLAPQACLAMLPALLILGTSSSSAMHNYNSYYSSPVVPLLFWGVLLGYTKCKNLRVVAHSAKLKFQLPTCLAVVLLIAPLIGGDYLKYPRPKPAVSAALDEILPILHRQPAGTTICVQAILFPHMPYDLDVIPYNPACGSAPHTAVLLNSELSTYPLSSEEFREALRSLPQQETRLLKAGFVLRQSNI